MPSWSRSLRIAFVSVIAGFLISLFWIVIAGLILRTFFKSYIRLIDIELIEFHFTQYGLAGIYNLPQSLIVGITVVLFFVLIVIFLSSLCFYTFLAKLTWNEIDRELKR